MTEDKRFLQLLEGCRQFREASQLALYRQCYSYAMGVCIRYARNKESAVEILNDGFLKVFQKIHQYDPAYGFRPWLRRILINASIDYYRKYEKDRPEELWLPEELSDNTYNEALDRLAFEDVVNMVQKLPPAYRMAFNLYVVECMSHAEIAEELGISVGTSKSNLAKARKKLRFLMVNSYHLKKQMHE